MDALMYFNNQYEYFKFGDETVQFPIGSSLISFIEMDALKSEDDPSKFHPYFRFIEKADKVEEFASELAYTASLYRTAVKYVLSNEIPEFNELGSGPRLYLFKHFDEPQFIEEDIQVQYIWLKAPNAKDIDESMIDFEHLDFDKRTFDSLADSVEDARLILQLAYHVHSVKEALRVAFIHMVMRNTIIKKCKCCDKYFIPVGRTDIEYCTRIAPGSSKHCNEIGATKTYMDRNKDNTIFQYHQKEYKKINARARLKKITREQNLMWSEKARALRDKAINENMDFSKFEKQLNEISRQEGFDIKQNAKEIK